MCDAPPNLPRNWLAVEMASPDLDPKTWPVGTRESFESLTRNANRDAARTRKDKADV